MLTQEQYTLYTGQTSNYVNSDWLSIVAVAEMRLASFLCLEELPTEGEGDEKVLPADLALLTSSLLYYASKAMATRLNPSVSAILQLTLRQVVPPTLFLRLLLSTVMLSPSIVNAILESK